MNENPLIPYGKLAWMLYHTGEWLTWERKHYQLEIGPQGKLYGYEESTIASGKPEKTLLYRPPVIGEEGYRR